MFTTKHGKNKEWEYLHVVWQFNGEFAFCNYKCPYCYYATGVMNRRVFKDAERWRLSFKKCFGDRKIIFYLSFGEPTYGQGFEEVVDMIASESNWILHLTTNLSRPLSWWKKLMEHPLVKEGRLYVNASFHPTETSIESFLEKLILLRKNGIECPVIIVMWPPILKDFKKYFEIFDRNGFLVHVRRFEGWYNGHFYPRSYSEAERQFIARYMDDASIKYMLNNVFGNTLGKLTYAGMYYILVDECGNVWESPDAKGKLLGNIFKGDLRLYAKPHPYPGKTCASVQGVAALLEVNYEELKPNFVLSFAKQGGVFHTNCGVHYKHINTNFNDPKIRKDYGFPNLLAKMVIALCMKVIDPFYLKMESSEKFRSKRVWLAMKLLTEFLFGPMPLKIRPCE